MHLWVLKRPAQITIAGAGMLEAEDDLIVFGLNVVAGGPSEYERCVSKAWSELVPTWPALPRSACPSGRSGSVGFATSPQPDFRTITGGTPGSALVDIPFFLGPFWQRGRVTTRSAGSGRGLQKRLRGRHRRRNTDIAELQT